MSARCAFTLLVVVVLSLLLASGSALSRPDVGYREAYIRLGQVDGEAGGDPDDSGPGGFTPGDDDLWDKPVPSDIDTKTADFLGVEGRFHSTFSSERPVERSARMAIWLRLLLRNWVFFVGAR